MLALPVSIAHKTCCASQYCRLMHACSLHRCRVLRLRRCLSRNIHHDLGPRPARIPKPAIDIKHIRQNPGLYESNCIQRNYPDLARHSWRILDLHNQCRELQSKIVRARQELKRLDNDVKRLVALLEKSKAAGESAEVVSLSTQRDDILNRKRALQNDVGASEPAEKEMQQLIEALAVELPNLTSTDTPDGDEPQLLAEIHSVQTHHNESHELIGSRLGIINIEAAASVSGWGFYYLIGAGAMLEQALVQHAMSVAIAAGFIPVIPPSLVYNHAAWACGFHPRDEGGNQQIYMLENQDSEDSQVKPKLALTGTAEIPLAGLYMNHKFSAEDLPLKHVGVSRSYRAEAGSRGKDTKGLYRVHEFTKVELFAWTQPDGNNDDTSTLNRFSNVSPSSSSTAVIQEMLSIQKAILSPLNIPLRILNQPATDLGASANMKYDIEGYFPSRSHAHWGELSSLSNCTDYQSRRLGTKIKTAQGTQWPYTLNGTAMAVPRVLAAILENNWDAEKGIVRIPECLQKWMYGAEVIEAPRSKR